MTDTYISRKIIERERYYSNERYLLLLETKFADLNEVIIKGKRRIVLLGDAGCGKSTELQRVAKKWIDERNSDFIPIYIELNTYVDEDIKDYIINKIGDDSKRLLERKSKIVFLFDEFDQVLNKEIATRKIKTFIESCSEAQFVISCRTNFYSGQFGEFDSFVILPFDYDDISAYSKQILKDEADVFIDQIEKSALLEVARNPFFLKQLMDIFQADNRLPARLSDILSRIVSISLDKDSERLSTKYDLKQKYSTAEIKKDLAYMSLVMETIQKNYISSSELIKILPDSYKRQVISELSLIKKSFFKEGDAYQFQHNNFQEELAAEVLATKDLDVILKFISYRNAEKRMWIDKVQTALGYFDVKPFGIKIIKILSNILNLVTYNNKITKINPSWVNTVAILCLLRAKNDLLEYLMQNQPELALKFEVERVDDNKKEALFKNIFEKYTSRGIPIDRDIDYESLAKFAETAGSRAKDIYEYLMNYAQSAKKYDKYNAISMLSRMRKFKTDSLQDLLIKYTKDDTEQQSIRHLCFYALAGLGMATPQTIDELKSLANSNDDWLLSGLYYLIKESDYVDEYVDILLSGIPRIKTYMSSTESRLVDESWNLIQGLEKVQSPESVKNFLKYLTAHPEDLQEFHIGKSLSKIINNFITAFGQDNSIYADVKALIKTVQNKYLESAVDNLIVFFRRTNTTSTLFKDLLEEDIDANYHLLALIADHSSVNFLIDQYNAGKITDAVMFAFTHYLQFNKDSYADLLKVINDKTGKFYPEPARDYKKKQEDELRRKVDIFFDISEFLKEVERIYTYREKDALTLGDIDDILHKDYKERACNNFVIREIRKNIFSRDSKKEWKLAEVKKEIEQLNYELFTVSHMFDLLYNGTQYDLSKTQQDFVEKFCMDHLKEVNFKTALSVKKDAETTTTNLLAVILWYFLRKLNLSYPEEILLDMLSYDWIEGHSHVGIDYLQEKLPPGKVNQKIITNLSEGILVNQVLTNHINYCKRYQMQEAAIYLIKIVKNHDVKVETRILALETVADLIDPTSFLKEMLDTEEPKLFSRTAELLMSRNSDICERKLIETLSSDNEKFALEAARLLIEKQNIEAIKFYANYIKKTKKFSSQIIGKTPLANIGTLKALPILFDLLLYSYEYNKEIEQDEFSRLDSAIIGILKNISRQNYVNFMEVRKQLEKFINKYQSRFENINYLNIVYDDIEKDFYINYRRQISIDEAIDKAKMIAL